LIRVLFIDDDSQAQKTLAMVLPEPYSVLPALTAAGGLEALEREDPDLVLLDVNLPDLDGLEVLERIVRRPLAPPVVMLTAYSDVELVKRAIQGGAYDYILKPYQLEQLEGTIRRAVQNAALRRSRSGTALTPGMERGLEALLGESLCMRELKALIARFAPADAPVLIQGESGTGKELVARALHELSPRREGPFVAVNCGAIPPTLLETELFGAERGAFTDARARPGCFERANEGTIFLDEIGEMPLQAQVSLLRVLEAKEVLRVGGTRSFPINVRVLSATHKELRAEVDARRFRDDLFYRLNVLSLTLPPLRERREDIRLLAASFLHQFLNAGARFQEQALQRLEAHSWPGNVRELRNAVERAALLSDGKEVRAAEILL
jgi:DNA-binding NtrC family response regulator